MDIGSENLHVSGALDAHAGGRTIQADGGDHRGRMPMAMRGAGVNTLSALGATSQAGQVGLRTRLVNEDESGGIPSKLSPTPCSARPRDVRAVLFASSECLFLYVSPISSKA